MKKIKVIDLLNKIANGEEVPEKIKYIGYIFEYDINHERYEAYIDGEICTLNEYININDDLNDEVEIIEEKKIPEKLEPLQKDYMTLDDIKFTFSNSEMIIVDKINSIIDYLKSKEKGE